MLERLKPTTFFCGLGALVLGFSGQLFLVSGRLLFAAGFYLSALLLILSAFHKIPGPTIILSTVKGISFQNWSRLRFITVGCSMASSVLGFWLFTTNVAPILLWLLHLISIGLLIFSFVWVEVKKRLENQSVDMVGDRVSPGNFRHLCFAPLSFGPDPF